MAKYCSAEDVQVLLGQQDAFDDSSGSRPTLTQVNSIIDQITSELDLRLKDVGIASQPTGSDQLNILKKYASWGSACVVGMSFFRNSDNVNDSQPDFYCVGYKEFIDDTEKLAAIFDGAISGDDVSISSQVIDATTTEASVNELFNNEGFKI